MQRDTQHLDEESVRCRHLATRKLMCLACCITFLFLCFRFDRAVDDASRALNILESSASQPKEHSVPAEALRGCDLPKSERLNLRVKAYYRRALAKRAIGAVDEARKDLQAVLAIQPQNKAAIVELKEISEQTGNDSKESSEAPKQKTLPTATEPKTQVALEKSKAASQKTHAEVTRLAAEPSPSVAKDVGKRSRVVKEENTNINLPAPVPATPSQSPAATDRDEVTVQKAVSQLKQDSECPTSPPRSALEFNKTWQALKPRPDLRAQYLTLIKPGLVPKLFSSSLDPELYSSLIATHSIRNVFVQIRLWSGSEMVDWAFAHAKIQHDGHVHVCRRESW
eukprot:c20564_g1_i5.p1 GENE.c20564_g1_i5~~c20564_g1_i5.p1  ORF type:complete len:339 (+),score=61.48 c20564_g1_i5:641-1657(+)